MSVCTIGQIQLILGPMFSGKSTELIRRIRIYSVSNLKCLVVKYINDNRYSHENVSTHDNFHLPAVSTDKLNSLNEKLVKSSNVIGIDEGQFFPDIVDFCDRNANDGKIIIVAALDGTFQRKPFGEVLNLVPLSDSVIKLNSVCMDCYRSAPYTKRLIKNNKIEIIGSSDIYRCVCRFCYFKNGNNS